jgi:TatA/E family protein of Tat protein translocase
VRDRAAEQSATVTVRTSKECTVLFGEIFGPDLLIVVIIVAVLVFGGGAIPKLARNLGTAKSEFEKGLKEAKSTGDATAASDVTSTTPRETDK